MTLVLLLNGEVGQPGPEMLNNTRPKSLCQNFASGVGECQKLHYHILDSGGA